MLLQELINIAVIKQVDASCFVCYCDCPFCVEKQSCSYAAVEISCFNLSSLASVFIKYKAKIGTRWGGIKQKVVYFDKLLFEIRNSVIKELIVNRHYFQLAFQPT